MKGGYGIPKAASTISGFYNPSLSSTNKISNAHHSAMNQKKEMEKIDIENARLYQKLRNRSCHVKKVNEMIQDHNI